MDFLRPANNAVSNLKSRLLVTDLDVDVLHYIITKGCYPLNRYGLGKQCAEALAFFCLDVVDHVVA